MKDRSLPRQVGNQSRIGRAQLYYDHVFVLLGDFAGAVEGDSASIELETVFFGRRSLGLKLQNGTLTTKFDDTTKVGIQPSLTRRFSHGWFNKG